jgi:hypothetical protein
MAQPNKRPSGFLVWITDSTLYCSKNEKHFSSFAFKDASIQEFSYKDIKLIDMLTGNPEASLLIPAGTGLLIGGAQGLMQGDDPPNEWLQCQHAKKRPF